VKMAQEEVQSKGSDSAIGKSLMMGGIDLDASGSATATKGFQMLVNTVDKVKVLNEVLGGHSASNALDVGSFIEGAEGFDKLSASVKNYAENVERVGSLHANLWTDIKRIYTNTLGGFLGFGENFLTTDVEKNVRVQARAASERIAEAKKAAQEEAAAQARADEKTAEAAKKRDEAVKASNRALAPFLQKDWEKAVVDQIKTMTSGDIFSQSKGLYNTLTSASAASRFTPEQIGDMAFRYQELQAETTRRAEAALKAEIDLRDKKAKRDEKIAMLQGRKTDVQIDKAIAIDRTTVDVMAPNSLQRIGGMLGGRGGYEFSVAERALKVAEVSAEYDRKIADLTQQIYDLQKGG